MWSPYVCYIFFARIRNLNRGDVCTLNQTLVSISIPYDHVFSAPFAQYRCFSLCDYSILLFNSLSDLSPCTPYVVFSSLIPYIAIILNTVLVYLVNWKCISMRLYRTYLLSQSSQVNLKKSKQSFFQAWQLSRHAAPFHHVSMK